MRKARFCADIVDIADVVITGVGLEWYEWRYEQRDGTGESRGNGGWLGPWNVADGGGAEGHDAAVHRNL